jgi:4-aminobutyrate aminotransferase
MTMAKGIASGLPLSGVAARRDLMEAWIPGSHGGTYGGNAVACAAAVATARVIKEEKLLENATRMGARLMDHLRGVQEDFPVIGDLRGLGLMIATEFSAEDGAPATNAAKAVTQGCLERGLMLLTCGPWNNTVRWIPPLVVSAGQVDEGVGIFRDALSEVMG